MRGYSLGAQQRLGFVGTILRCARLFMLDESANGTNPVGIRDPRGR